MYLFRNKEKSILGIFMAFFPFFEFVSPTGLFKFFIKICSYLIFIVNALGNYKKILHVENK